MNSKQVLVHGYAATVLALTLSTATPSTHAQSPLSSEVSARAAALEQKMIAWRRDIHEHPELGNRETRTAKLVTEHLQRLGLEVKTNVAHTGVVALLRGGLPGGVVALRADMDALPVPEETGLPFASKVRTQYNGKDTPVAHACGHDAHTAILMAVAELLTGMKDRIPGTVKFIFQPAEEGTPEGEEGGAALMIKQGVLENPKPGAIFGLHVVQSLESGKIAVRPGPMMASVDNFTIQVKGSGGHGGIPWNTIDPVVTASQIVLGLQTIISRQTNIALEPAVVSVGAINGGNRFNVIPDQVEMIGTVRTYNEDMRKDIHARIKAVSENIAKAAGASVQIKTNYMYNPTVNHEGLTTQMRSTLARVSGANNFSVAVKSTGAEDFSFYQEVMPGMFYFLGVRKPGVDVKSAAPNHSPRFNLDESGLLLGINSLSQLALDYLQSVKP